MRDLYNLSLFCDYIVLPVERDSRLGVSTSEPKCYLNNSLYQALVGGHFVSLAYIHLTVMPLYHLKLNESDYMLH